MPLVHLSRLRVSSTSLCASVLAAALLTACAGLPAHVDRPVSTAIAVEASGPTALAAIVQQRRDASRARQSSGFVLLGGPAAAYGSRLALADGAQKTLDLQYYAIHADGSTERLMTAVVAAAARGVRVRILLDDFHTTGHNALVMTLALVPNIQMRMFNPLSGPRASSIGRMLSSIEDAQRIQQRMHNKLFVADNVLAVTGGRNLGDAYFGRGEKDNFVDLDVLAAGPVVQDMSRSFDSYWNNERSFPVESLVSRDELLKMRDQVQAEIKAGRTSDQAATPKLPDGEPTPSKPASEAQLARAWDQKPMDLSKADFIWAPALLVADKPGKIPVDNPGSPAQTGQLAVDAGRPDRLGAAGDALADGDTVVEGLLQMIGQAKSELVIVSPYFVPGADMKKAFADARSRGVRVRVLTNSLASNDAPVAHVGYARHREELLAMGVELYELRSESANLRSALGASGSSGMTGESRSMLHSKVLVMDGQLLVIGSMNLDLRSQLQNTELALLIRSTELSARASKAIVTVLEEDAWRVQRDGGSLVWRAPAGSGLNDAHSEPDTSATLRFMLKVIGPLAPDSLL